MFKAFVLVRNLQSNANTLDFGQFTISRIGNRCDELQRVLSSSEVYETDWVLEQAYSSLPPGPPGSVVGGIPRDIEDSLLLLRLYRVDISFIKRAITPPSGQPQGQSPYRAMNDLNSYSLTHLQYEVDVEACKPWKEFADSVRKSQSWRSEWFSTARRFFLSGGAKQFNPEYDDVDRIVDYVFALEAALVWEGDFNARRMRNRGALIVPRASPEQREAIISLINRLYRVRSSVVHGSVLGDKDRKWLFENSRDIEQGVRDVLVAAVQALPPGERDRRVTLAKLYDPTDEDRKADLIRRFEGIKATDVRHAAAAEINQLASQ